MKHTVRVTKMLAAAIVIALTGAVEASAQMSLTGAWTFTVDLDGSITYPAVTLVQDGETLTGHYSSEGLGENDITGTVSEMKITIMFSADPGLGMVIDVVYTGTIDAEGMISGTLDLGGLAQGTFTAVKTEA
jgi:hypothetical protein|tara:strand:- start:5450 stop:5845 length:396 start_codon:yes stop_codon:yes gene_type:complete